LLLQGATEVFTLVDRVEMESVSRRIQSNGRVENNPP
jgi:hypothetical protein